MILTAFNPSTNNLEKSYLTADYSSGVTALVLRNNDRFSEDDFILVGEMGSENAEIVQITGAVSSGTDITVGATTFPHSASDPVYVLGYNQIKFHRSTSTVDGIYSSIATVNIDVDNTSGKTLYDDTTGLTSYFYKISFYNSGTTVESSLSDPMAGSGYTRSQVGSIVNDFLVEIGDLEQEYITVPQILSMMNEVNDDIKGQSRKPYRFLSTKKLATITSGSDRVPLPTDMLRLDRVRYNEDNGIVEVDRTLPIISIEELEYKKFQVDPLPAAGVASIKYLAIDYTTDELVIYPTPKDTQTDKLTFYYWSEINTFDSLADEVQTPNPRIYKLFLLGRHYRIRAKKESSFLQLSDRYNQDYNTEIVKLQRAQKVDVGTPMSMLPDTRTSHGLRR